MKANSLHHLGYEHEVVMKKHCFFVRPRTMIGIVAVILVLVCLCVMKFGPILLAQVEIPVVYRRSGVVVEVEVGGRLLPASHFTPVEMEKILAGRYHTVVVSPEYSGNHK